MNKKPINVDTNVLVYSRDASEPQKEEQAMAWTAHLFTEDLQENQEFGSLQVTNPSHVQPTSLKS
jgi:hypothetical protein